MSADNGVYILKTLKASNAPPSVENLREGITALLDVSVSDIKGAINALLETSGEKRYEYRVKHLQAVDNVYWDENRGTCSADDDQCIINAREMWRGAEVFLDAHSADIEAHRVHDEVEYTEYGIGMISIDRVF